jgi:hypothetical protein
MINVNCKKCEHGKKKSLCKECGGSGICEHGKRKDYCKDCGGSQICEHGKNKSSCKECDGSQICEHGKHKTYCKECGGSQICEHEKEKRHCKECGGSALCEHEKIKRFCKECGGSALCEHGKRKNICKECGGSEICEHGIQRRGCRECKGTSICEHGKFKNSCKECGGTSICEHGKQKNICKECGGNSICEHGKRKSRCTECGGSEFCEHGKYKSSCKECGTGRCQSEACSIYDDIDKPRGCISHNGIKLCTNCYNHTVLGDAKPKTMVRKEQFVLAEVQRQLPELEDFFVLWDCPIDGGCSNKRPDMLFDFKIGCLVIEIDEDAHRYEDLTCRNKRMCEIFEDLAERPIVFIRFNPDKYGTRSPMFRMTAKTHQLKCNETEFQFRMEKLIEEIKKVYKTCIIDNQIPDKEFDVVNLFM